MPTVIHRGNKRGRNNRPDARQGCKPATGFMLAADADELGVELCKAGFDVGELIHQLSKQLAGRLDKSASYGCRDLLTKAPRAFR